ncbi:hypothetical protein Aph01nite_43500 [Acrocarpospora phusangensis]|uniref:Uncharacterized protein n=1 Tax=Acrocarpospora phusangensis TaxID=1070424 RepID=A0A919QES0_9ACTN|nr:hypothetical protein Aph01nite_43500 [Acrocarpospora phusangensis]
MAGVKVRFRTYCYPCRRMAPRHRRPHRWEWEYWISCEGVRLVQRQGFGSFDRAWMSAERSWFKLAALSCVAPESTRMDP